MKNNSTLARLTATTHLGNDGLSFIARICVIAYVIIGWSFLVFMKLLDFS